MDLTKAYGRIAQLPALTTAFTFAIGADPGRFCVRFSVRSGAALATTEALVKPALPGQTGQTWPVRSQGAVGEFWGHLAGSAWSAIGSVGGELLCVTEYFYAPPTPAELGFEEEV